MPNGSDNKQGERKSEFGEKMVFADEDETRRFYEDEKTRKQRYVLGAVIGDIIGSAYEFRNYKGTDFDLFGLRTKFTDDSVLTWATMDVILHKGNYARTYKSYGLKYPDKGYGGMFLEWLYGEGYDPFNSYGNGSAMRVSPVGWAYDRLDIVMKEAKRSAEVTHNHTEGIKGAQATASAVYMARTGSSKQDIRDFIEAMFGYDLSRSIDEIHPYYSFDESCHGSVPEAMTAFLESRDYESAVRLAVSIGGDSDTIACIAGGIAEAFYKEIPDWIVDNALRLIPPDIIKLIDEFSFRFRH
jgi:ADP-ribosylglycohydrolase